MLLEENVVLKLADGREVKASELQMDDCLLDVFGETREITSVKKLNRVNDFYSVSLFHSGHDANIIIHKSNEIATVNTYEDTYPHFVSLFKNFSQDLFPIFKYGSNIFRFFRWLHPSHIGEKNCVEIEVNSENGILLANGVILK